MKNCENAYPEPNQAGWAQAGHSREKDLPQGLEPALPEAAWQQVDFCAAAAAEAPAAAAGAGGQ